MNSEYRDIARFTDAIQAIFPRLMHYLNHEESRELTGWGSPPARSTPCWCYISTTT